MKYYSDRHKQRVIAGKRKEQWQADSIYWFALLMAVGFWVTMSWQ